MLFKKILAPALAGLLTAQSVSAQDAEAEKKTDLNVTGHGKTAIIATERQKKGWYDSEYHFSPAVRAGDFIFISGAVAGAYGAEEPVGKDALKESIRRAFGSIKATLAAGGATMDQIVKIRTFHVFDSEWISIPKREQIKAVAEVKSEFMGEPHAAWTAVGTTALFPDQGLVEIEVVVYAPTK